MADRTSKPFLTCREFLKTSAAKATATLAIPAIVSASALGSDGKAPANDRITVGMIGVGRQAKQYNLPWFLKSPETQVVAVCDVDAWRLNNAVETVNKNEKGVRSMQFFTPGHMAVIEELTPTRLERRIKQAQQTNYRQTRCCANELSCCLPGSCEHNET